MAKSTFDVRVGIGTDEHLNSAEAGITRRVASRMEIMAVAELGEV